MKLRLTRSPLVAATLVAVSSMTVACSGTLDDTDLENTGGTSPGNTGGAGNVAGSAPAAGASPVGTAGAAGRIGRIPVIIHK